MESYLWTLMLGYFGAPKRWQFKKSLWNLNLSLHHRFQLNGLCLSNLEIWTLWWPRYLCHQLPQHTRHTSLTLANRSQRKPQKLLQNSGDVYYHTNSISSFYKCWAISVCGAVHLLKQPCHLATSGSLSNTPLKDPSRTKVSTKNLYFILHIFCTYIS